MISQTSEKPMRRLSCLLPGLLVASSRLVSGQQVAVVKVTPAHTTVTAGDTVRFLVKSDINSGLWVGRLTRGAVP
jgi:hypothetical protein